jgi:alpha-tubulin suppressor-like RCC1 family protein
LGLTGVTAIAGDGFTSLAGKSDSTLWTWGILKDGQSFSNNFQYSKVPVPITSK